jgi:DNA-binding CsgD family transcriptional regulator
MPADRDPHLRLASLTPRERDCLRLVLDNRSSKEVGRQLGISPASVDTHVRRARAKLGVADRYAAARLLAQWEQDQAKPAEAAPAAGSEPAAARPTPPPAEARRRGLPPLSELGIPARLGLVALCAAFMAVVFGLGLAVLRAL